MTVAVAHQGQAGSEQVLAEAVRESHLRGGPLVVVHVVTSKDLDSEEALRTGIGDLVSSAATAQDVTDLDWEVRIVTSDDASIDDTAAAVLDAVRDAGADLLVIGARRRSPVGKAFLGSVTQQILLDSPVPVLTVRGGGR